MKFELEPFHLDVSDKDLIDDLIRVAKSLKKNSVTIDEYNDHGKFHASTLQRRFESWFKALEKAGLKKTRTLGVTDEEYFENLEEVWRKLGRQPKYNDGQKPFSKYCAGAYEYRFGTWRKGLERFIKYVNKEEKLAVKTVKEEHINSKKHKHRTKRGISWRLRFIVMRRDNFRCRICGRSPAANPKTTLHVDHVIPWSKGGETIPDNLQTLCSKCNIGKSNLDQ